MAEEKKTYKFVCVVCGYEVEVDTPELGPFSSVPKGSRLLLADPVCCESGRLFVSICNI